MIFSKFVFKKTRKKGMSMVEVLVAMGLVGLVSLFLSSVYLNSLSSLKSVEQKYSLAYLNDDIRRLLGDKDSCFATFNGKSFSYSATSETSTESYNVTQLKKANVMNPFVYYTYTDPTNPNQVYSDGNIRIDTITLEKYTTDVHATSATDPNFYKGTANLFFDYSKNAKSIGPTSFRRSAKLQVTLYECQGCPPASAVGATCNPECLGTSASPLEKTIKTCQISTSGGGDGFWSPTAAADGIYYNGGKVGIGTTTPLAQVSIQGDGVAGSGGLLHIGKAKDAGGFEKGAIGAFDDSTGKYQVFDIGGKDQRFFVSADAAGTPNGPVAMFLQNTTGNVGIGTTNPSSQLHVVGQTVRIEHADNNTSGPGYDFYRNSATHTGQIVAFKNGIDGSSLNFYTKPNGGALSAVGPRMTIDNNGNVGIGTTNPLEKFVVAGSNLTQRLVLTENGTGISTKLVAAIPPDSKLISPKGYVGTQSNHPFAIGADDKDWIMVLPNGNIGIGTSSPDQRFVVFNGATTGKYTTGGWTHISDRRLKKDIAPINEALQKILNLQGVEFIFKADPKKEKQVGLIAQDVEKVIPEVVKTDGKGFKSLVYGNLVAPIVEAIKTLYNKILRIETNQNEIEMKLTALQSDMKLIDELKKENAQLRKENLEQKNRIDKIEKVLSSDRL